jgi:hypothetical protein
MGLNRLPASTQRKGVTDLLHPCRPSLHPPLGPDVCLPKMLTLHRGDAAGREVIGPPTRAGADRFDALGDSTLNWALDRASERGGGSVHPNN